MSPLDRRTSLVRTLTMGQVMQKMSFSDHMSFTPGNQAFSTATQLSLRMDAAESRIAATVRTRLREIPRTRHTLHSGFLYVCVKCVVHQQGPVCVCQKLAGG